ncbi:Short-chain dehydrogenase/reductase family protein [Mycena venus]|uniref:Short-chain dehydrogenase/reductase family protein n=1 Tax=Mycena venus TaxID=2733690 RepID=A0A8H7D6F4_9AGAR|nr:Short-chain dehydrogenase/reductase family protein [Mycena venus]
MVDRSLQIALVTGGNTGIGYQTVKQLLLKNAKVYLAARSAEKATAAIKRLEEETGKSAIFIQVDLADLPSVRKAADAFLARESKLDLLFNNGGVMTCPVEMLTAQGHDLQFGTNVIGHFFLTELLLPALTKSHQETNVRARILNTSSIGHQMAPGNGIDFVSLKGGPERDAWIKEKRNHHRRLYGESKMGNILVSKYFARTHANVLASCAVHPGGIKTELSRYAMTICAGCIAQLTLALGTLRASGKPSGSYSYPPAPWVPPLFRKAMELNVVRRMGAYTQLWGATMVSPEQINGQVRAPYAHLIVRYKRASDRELEDKVIAYIREQIKGF